MPARSSPCALFGNYVYLSCVSFGAAGGPFDITIIRYNTETQTGEELYTEKGVSQYLGKIWVTEQGEIYLPGAGAGKAYVWKIQDGQRKEMLSWEDGDDSPPDLLDEVVVHITRKEYTRWLNVMDYTGKTLYEGKLFPQPVPGLEVIRGCSAIPRHRGRNTVLPWWAEIPKADYPFERIPGEWGRLYPDVGFNGQPETHGFVE